MANLLDSCRRDLTEVVMALLQEEELPIDARDVNQWTPLHHACIKGNMEVAMALVDRGADVHARDVDQRTPLHEACINGHLEFAMALVDRGADVDAEDDDQRTLLFACVNGRSEVALALTSRGANAHATEGAVHEDEWDEDEDKDARPR